MKLMSQNQKEENREMTKTEKMTEKIERKKIKGKMIKMMMKLKKIITKKNMTHWKLKMLKMRRMTEMRKR